MAEPEELPKAIESEKALLAACLNQNDGHECACKVFELILPEDFYKTDHQRIATGIFTLLSEGVSISLDSILAKLGEMGLVGNNGLGAHVGKLMEWPAAIDVEYQAGLVRKAAIQRKAIIEANKLLQAVKQAPDPEEIEKRFDAALRSMRVEAEIGTPKSRFELIQIGDVEVKAPEFIIDGLVEADSLILVFGDPECGKSFLSVDAACSIATGNAFHGKKTQKGPVIYIAGEGQNGLKRRFLGWSIRHGVDLGSSQVFLSLLPAALCDNEQTQNIMSAVNKVAEQHGPPALIIIDTLARNFGPGDENSTRDMTAFIQSADALRAQYRSSVLLIHHSGHGDKTRARGAMALKGALDAEYRMDKDDTGVIRFESTKMKDAEHPDPMAFVLRSVELGLNTADGKPVTSAILDDTDYEPKITTGNQAKGKWQVIALEVLDKLHDEHRQRLESSGFNPDTARVTLDDWRKGCARHGMDRKQFSRVKLSLSKQEIISVNSGFVELSP